MSPVSFLIFVICACTFFLIGLNRWLSVPFSLNSKDFLFLPPSRFPPTHNPFLSVDYSVCHLVSKYLGIFLMFFCYWPLNYFHCGKRTHFVWLGSFAGICFMAQNTVSLGTRPRGALHTLPDAQWVMKCPRWPLGAGSVPTCLQLQLHFLFSSRVGLPPAPAIFLTSLSDSQSDEDSGQRAPWLRLRDPFLCIPTAQPSPDSQSPFFSRQGSPSPWSPHLGQPPHQQSGWVLISASTVKALWRTV